MAANNFLNQKKAENALNDNNPEQYFQALESAVKLDFADKNNGTFDPKRSAEQEIIESAILGAMSEDSLCDILWEMKKRRHNVKAAIEKKVSHEDIFKLVENEGFLEFLLDHWPELLGTWEHEALTPHRLASKGYDKMLDVMLRRGLDANKQDCHGKTALMYAEDGETAKTLINAGANPQNPDAHGKTAVWHAVKLLVKKAKKSNGGPIKIRPTTANAIKEIVDNEALINDPDASLLVRQIQRRFDLGLKIGRSEASTHPTFKDLVRQMDVIHSRTRSKQLEKFLVSNGMRTRNTKKNERLGFLISTTHL